MSRLGALIVAAVVGCGGAKKPAPTPPAPGDAAPLQGSLTVEVDPPDAEVEIDGTSRGADRSPFTLVQGAHQIVIRKPGFEIWRGEVEIKGETEKIQVKLVPLKK
jgi:hypothetical protein